MTLFFVELVAYISENKCLHFQVEIKNGGVLSVLIVSDYKTVGYSTIKLVSYVAIREADWNFQPPFHSPLFSEVRSCN